MSAAPLLRQVFGFDGFRPGQEEIVDAVAAGRDVLAIMPTGGGKSLCYQLPALMRDGLTVVVSPLIALMRDQVRALTEADFVRILTETDNALTRQYAALMGTEGVEVAFTDDGIAALARIAAEVNGSVENIGARRLYTVMERVFEELSFAAPDADGQRVTVDAAYVEAQLGDLARSADLSRYVL